MHVKKERPFATLDVRKSWFKWRSELKIYLFSQYLQPISITKSKKLTTKSLQTTGVLGTWPAEALNAILHIIPINIFPTASAASDAKDYSLSKENCLIIWQGSQTTPKRIPPTNNNDGYTDVYKMDCGVGVGILSEDVEINSSLSDIIQFITIWYGFKLL